MLVAISSRSLDKYSINKTDTNIINKILKKNNFS